ncbi:site-specific integrase [Candidatus Ichthyocystis hellenicum]|uniref:site-specific integrase n=1 Tax=Candidatus Ichthyocystis hellenicum TaxID=1561003 RepID=UPI000B88732E|nr:site-specific integrase [Candidatus Ichthyocystis hellenicum]
MTEDNEESKLYYSSYRNGSLLATERSTQIREYIHASTAENTRKTYRSAIIQFERWGGLLPATKDMLVQYLLDKANNLCPSTLSLHITAISQWHCYQNLPDPGTDPTIKKIMIGIRRKHGRPPIKAKPLTVKNITTFIDNILSKERTIKTIRDMALLQVAFFGAFRRSELVNIHFEDISWTEKGVTINLKRSKTDQEGHGTARTIPFGKPPICPVTALREWMIAANLDTGPVFRAINRWNHLESTPLHPSSINIFLKKIAEECGIDPKQISSHSFRRGFSTAAASENIGFNLIKKQGGWKNDSTVHGYIEEGCQFSENAAGELMKIINTNY